MFNGLGHKIASFLFGVFLTTAAFGAITPEEAWEHMIDRFKGSDFTVSGVKSIEGDTLYISELIFENESFSDGYSLKYIADNWRFRPESDGTVSLQMAQDATWRLELKDDDKAFLTVYVGQSMTGSKFILSRENNHIKEEFSFENLLFKFLKLEDDSGAIAQDQLLVSLSFKDFVGTSLQAKPNGTRTNAAVGEFLIDALASPTERDFGVSWNSKFFNLKFSSNTQNQGETLTEGITTALRGGMSSSSIYGYDSGQTTMNYFHPKGNVVIDSSSNGGSISADISKFGLKFLSDISSWDFSVKGSLVPVPVAFSIMSLVYDGTLPVIASKIEQKVGVRIGVQELGISETFWDMFDPLKIFDRNSFSLMLDLEGVARLMTDYMSVDWNTTNDFDGLAEVLAVSINEFVVSGLGAEFSADGMFTFDNDDHVTFEGFPRPEGDIRLSVKGLNDVLQKMSTTGLIGSEEVMGARMLMGMFTVPIGMDELEAELWIDPTGVVYANGQRIR